MFAPTFMRHMYEYGTRPEQVAHVKRVHTEHASNNPKAFYKKRFTVDDVLNSRIICKPLHLLDCCVETDNATALIVTAAERARGLRHHPALIRGVVGRCSKPRTDMHYQHGPISTVAGHYAKDILWPNAGVGPEDIDVTGCYDAFTFTTMLQLEDYGFCKKGEGGDYVSDGTIRLGGKRPNNTSGGHLCEGYTHGINMVIENVRQLRHDADDSCPVGPDGKRQHTYDYREGGCRQVKDCEVSANLGWANAGHRLGHGHAARLEGRQIMANPGDLSRHAARRSTISTSRTSPTSSIARRTTSTCSAATPAGWCAIRRPRPARGAPARSPTGCRSRARGRCIPTPRCITPSSRRSRRTRPISCCWSISTRRRASRREHEALRVIGNLVTPDGTLAPPEMVKTRRHRHAGAHGVRRRGAGPGAAAMDHRRGRAAAREAVALSAGIA